MANYLPDQYAEQRRLSAGTVEAESTQKKGYKLPRAPMTNSDLTRLINSDEVQSVVRPKKTVCHSVLHSAQQLCCLHQSAFAESHLLLAGSASAQSYLLSSSVLQQCNGVLQLYSGALWHPDLLDGLCAISQCFTSSCSLSTHQLVHIM